MPTVHIVRQGECFTGIASQYGFRDYRQLYDSADNQALRKRRPNPNVLRPGDRIVVPDVRQQTVNGGTDQIHRFVVRRPLKELRIVLKDHSGQTLASRSYSLSWGTVKRSGTTDGDGLLRERIPIGVLNAELDLGERVVALRLGHLIPVDPEVNDCSGVQARLSNLGYDVGPIDGQVGPRTRAAIAVFQADHDLTIDGEADATTQSSLRNAHGC